VTHSFLIYSLQRAVQLHGHLDGALLHSNFTVKGKEEYSDVIKKLLRDKYPGVPLIAWGERSDGVI